MPRSRREGRSRSLARLADDNLATHFTWVQERLPGMRVIRDDELVLTDSGLPCDTFNAACRARLPRAGARERVQAAIGWFAEAGRPFSWWVGPGDRPSDLGRLLEAEGLEPAETELAMALDLALFGEPEPPPPGLEIRRVTSKAEVLLTPESAIRLYIGSVDGVPVAASELTVGGGAVGLYNISTLRRFRRRGIGSAMTRWPLREAAREGYRTAVLQAAEDGVGIYRRVGFQAFGGITEYKPPQD